MPPRLARLLAVVAAVGLVTGAFAVRSAIAGDDEDERADPAGEEPDGDDPSTGSYVLACDEDLGTACDTLADELGHDRVEIVRAVDVLATEDPAWDAWLTLDPMGGVLDSTRIEAGLVALTGGRVEVASSTLALLALEEPPGGCDDDPSLDWTCLLDPPEPIPNGIPVPDAETSLGTLAIAAAATALQGTTSFGRGDYEGTSEADAVIALLRDSPTQAGQTSVDQTNAMFSPGTAAAAVTTTGLADDRADRGQGRDRGLRVVPLSPEVTVGVVLVGLGVDGEEAVGVLESVVTGQTVVDALADAGWMGGAEPTDGLPVADVIYGVREELG